MSSLSQKEIIVKVNSYFETVAPKKIRCNLCEKNLCGSISNKKDHLLAKYQEIAYSIRLKAKEKSQNNVSNEDPGTLNSQPTKKIKLEIDVNQFIQNHIKLILMHNHALSSIEDIMNMPHNKHICESFNICINQRTFTQFIINASQQIYKLISEEVKDKFPSLGFDSATKYGRSVFSTHMRYLLKGEVKERTLGIITQHGRQYGDVLASQVTDLLNKIDKPLDDIYSCCTDGGKNMIKAQENIIAAQRELEIYSSFFNTHEELNINEFIDEEDESLPLEIDEAEHIDFNTIINIEKGLGPFCSKGNCGAHVLQLAAKDVTKDFEPTLQKIRAFVKESKKIQYIENFRDLKKPCLDIGPRWDSTFLMIEKFEEQKVAFSQIRTDKLKLSRDVWSFITEYYETFRPVHLAMKDFQSERYTASDFILRWLKMKLQLERIQAGSFNLSTKLVASTNERFKKFFPSEALCASLILDPRFTWNTENEIFNETVKNKGINNIIKVHSKIHANVEITGTEESPIAQDASIPIVNQIDEDFNLQVFLSGGSQIEYRQVEYDIKHQINKFIYSEQRVRLSENFDILKFWHAKRDDPNYRDLYPVLQVVFGQCFTQVKTERDFSSFALIYNHLRTRLSDEVLNSIFVVKHNIDLLEKIKFF